MHVDDQAAWQTTWHAALMSGVGFEIEFRLLGKNGWRWYQTYVAPLADDQGHILHWLFKAIDIHQRKELEANLRNSRNQAELLNQVGLDLVGELDLQRLTQRVTDTARALVDAEFAVMLYHVNDPDVNDGHRRYAVSGLPVSLFSEIDMPQTIELFSSTFIGQNVVQSDDVRSDPRFADNLSPLGLQPGHLPMVSYLAVPVRTRHGTVFGGVFCGHSQPGQFTKQHERLLLGIATLAAGTFDSARLIESERRQRRLADQRTTELARSNAELEQFAYICSHDLQEPLRMVSSFLSLLEERYSERLDERGVGYIHRAMDGSSRMQNLIRDILAFSRVGRGEHAEEILGMAEVVQVALENLHSAIEENSARIELGELPTVRVNRLQCVQLMQNLIGNALKFHGHETPLIRISAEQAGPMWRFSVTDNSIGIDPCSTCLF